MADVDKSHLIAMQINLRDNIRPAMLKRHKEELAAVDEQMAKIQRAFTGMFNRELLAKGREHAQTSIKTPQGRAYRDAVVSYRVTDAAKYKEYLAMDAPNRIAMAHARVNNTELEAHLQLQGKTVPRDGVEYEPEVIPGVEAVIEIKTKFVKPT